MSFPDKQFPFLGITVVVQYKGKVNSSQKLFTLQYIKSLGIAATLSILMQTVVGLLSMTLLQYDIAEELEKDIK